MTNQEIIAKIEKKVKDIWGGSYYRPDTFEIRIGDYKGETAVFIKADRSYHAPALTFAQLLKLSEYFKTTRIDTVNDWSYEGCETCNFGSSYGWELAILPPTKEQKEITQSSHGWMIIEDL